MNSTNALAHLVMAEGTCEDLLKLIRSAMESLARAKFSKDTVRAEFVKRQIPALVALARQALAEELDKADTELQRYLIELARQRIKKTGEENIYDGTGSEAEQSEESGSVGC